MTKLDVAREEICSIDKKMAALFERRMNANIKRKTDFLFLMQEGKLILLNVIQHILKTEC